MKNKTTIRVLGLCLFMFAISTVLYSMKVRGVQFFDKDYSHFTLLRTKEQAISEKDSPHLQLVGLVNYSRKYGIFSRNKNSFDAAGTNLTVVYKEGKYFTVGGVPRNYLRTLLDADEYPLLALPKTALTELSAASDEDALDKATEILKGSFQE